MGKTTHARLVEKELKTKGISASYVWMRWNHKLSLPLLFLARLLKLTEVEQLQSGKKIVYHHFDRVRPLAMMYEYASLIDTLFTLILKIRARIWMGKFVVCDRSVYDVLIDLMVSTRNSKLLDSIAAKLYLSMACGTTTVMLRAGQEALRCRREDLREDKDLELRIHLYSNLSSKPTITVINAEESIADVHAALMRVIDGIIDETG